VEIAPEVCVHCAREGTVVVDTPEAVHEAGDLLQAGLDVAQFPTLRDVIAARGFSRRGPVLFKSCGWAGWDLAAARTAVQSMVRT
jgi:1-piperideine-2-carboxylate/1-pyrroline-2-carboxylate reductase [NAD(P)H]